MIGKIGTQSLFATLIADHQLDNPALIEALERAVWALEEADTAGGDLSLIHI